VTQGWVKFHRQIIDNPRASDPHWMSLWSWLILLATHQPVKMVFGTEVITLKPGQLITSRESLESKTGINQHKIDRLLKVLKSEQQIEQQTSSSSRLITILNWGKYQQNEQPSAQQVSSDCAAVEQQLSTNKNIKNVRMKEVNNPLPLFPAEPVAELVIPQHLRTESFMKVWSDWVNFRKSIKKVKDWLRLFQYQLDWLKDFPEATAMAILSQSLMNGWQGLKPVNGVRPSAIAGTKPEPSLFNLRTVKEAKESQAAQLKHRHCSEDALSETWDDDRARAEYRQLRKEIKELNTRIGAMKL
jgi:hypothetical protein